MPEETDDEAIIDFLKKFLDSIYDKDPKFIKNMKIVRKGGFRHESHIPPQKVSELEDKIGISLEDAIKRMKDLMINLDFGKEAEGVYWEFYSKFADDTFYPEILINRINLDHLDEVKIGGSGDNFKLFFLEFGDGECLHMLHVKGSASPNGFWGIGEDKVKLFVEQTYNEEIKNLKHKWFVVLLNNGYVGYLINRKALEWAYKKKKFNLAVDNYYKIHGNNLKGIVFEVHGVKRFEDVNTFIKLIREDPFEAWEKP